MSEEFVRVKDTSTGENYNLPAQKVAPGVMQVVQDYGLTTPDDLVVLYESSALRPEQQEAEKPLAPSNKAVDEHAKEDPLQTLRQVKRFAKRVGGLKQADEMLHALEAVAMPIPQLMAWIKVLREE